LALHFLYALEQMQGFLDWKRRHHPDWPDLRLEWGLYHQLRGGLALGEASAPDLREKAEGLLAEAYLVLSQNQDAERSFPAFGDWDAWTSLHMPIQGEAAPAPSAGEAAERLRANLGEDFEDLADELLERAGTLDAQPEMVLRAALGRPFGRLFATMAEYFAFQGECDRARELAAWAVLAEGNPARHWILSAQVERICGRGHEAVRLLDEGLARFPERIELMRERAQEFERHGDMDQALSMMRRAVDLRPDWPDLRFELGRLLQDAERNEESLAQFGKALELNPRYERAARSRGELLEQLGLEPGAGEAFEGESAADGHARVYRMLSEVYAERGDRARAEHFGRLAQGSPLGESS